MTASIQTGLLTLARETALSAADLVHHRRESGVTVAASKSSAEDIVTHADREGETLIRALIAGARPNDGFYGEESEATPGSSGLTWVVDPIDGTVNYLYGIPGYAVSIAVVEGDPDPATWTTLAGVVVNPAAGEVFTAMAGAGALLGDRMLRVNAGVPLELSLLGTGFSYSASRRVQEAAVVRALIGRVRDIRRMGSAALDLCAVAAGRLDLYYERGLNPWDHAAGALIAREAGARVGGLGGDRESGELLIASAPDLYDAFEPLLTQAISEHLVGDEG